MSMLMFQNGLLATFIPEILMVLGYILCLITPGLKSDKTEVQHTQLVTRVTYSNQNQTTTYQLTSRDFQTTSEFIPESNQSLPHLIQQTVIVFSRSLDFTSDGLSYVSFSRPPPSFIS